MKKDAGKIIISKISMQKQMMLYFSVPLLIVQLISSILCYPVLLNTFRKQISYSQEQSVTQAISFVENYIHNMEYLAAMVENNKHIYAVLSR